jgi:hypothetical protein
MKDKAWKEMQIRIKKEVNNEDVEMKRKEHTMYKKEASRNKDEHSL